jgi:hypothetical protein
MIPSPDDLLPGDPHARTIKGGMSSRPSWGQHQYEAASSAVAS